MQELPRFAVSWKVSNLIIISHFYDTDSLVATAAEFDHVLAAAVDARSVFSVHDRAR